MSADVSPDEYVGVPVGVSVGVFVGVSWVLPWTFPSVTGACRGML